MTFGCAPVPALMGDGVIDSFSPGAVAQGPVRWGAVSRGVRMRFGFTAGSWRRAAAGRVAGCGGVAAGAVFRRGAWGSSRPVRGRCTLEGGSRAGRFGVFRVIPGFF